MPHFDVTTIEGGGCMTTGPIDVCKLPGSPPIPTPLPNIGQCRDGKKVTKKVKIRSKPVITENSELASSSGDEAGTLKGLVAPFQGSKVKFTRGSSKVKAEGHGVVSLTAPTKHNGPASCNAPAGLHAQSSQSTVSSSL